MSQLNAPCWNPSGGNPKTKDPTDNAPWFLDQFYLGESTLRFIHLDEPDTYSPAGGAPGAPQWKLSFDIGDEEAVVALNEALGQSEGWLQDQYQAAMAKSSPVLKTKQKKAGVPGVSAKEAFKYVGEGDEKEVEPTGVYYVQCTAPSTPLKLSNGPCDLTPRVFEILPSGKARRVPVAERTYGQGTKAKVYVRPRLMWLSDKGYFSLQLQPTTIIVTEAQSVGGAPEDAPLPEGLDLVEEDSDLPEGIQEESPDVADGDY